VKKIKICLIFENYHELLDLLDIIRFLQTKYSIDLKIVSPSNIYQDIKSNNILSKLSEDIEILYLPTPKKNKYKELSTLKKILFAFQTRRIIQHYFDDVDLILSGVQTIFSRIIYKITRKNSIPFYVYHRHLIFSSSYNSTNTFYNNIFIKTLLSILKIDEFVIETPNVGFADKYFVLGELNKKYLVKHNIPKEDIYVTGSLEYDNIDKIKKTLNKSTNKKVCFITSAFEWVGDNIGESNQALKIQKCIEFVEKNDNYELTIRIHPRENYEKYRNLQKKYPSIKLEYPQDKSVIEDLKKYDLIIGSFSTAMFEIALLDKPILFYCLESEMEKYKDILEYIPSELVVSSLNKGLVGGNLDVSKIIYYDKDEKAIDRIVNILQKEINA